MKFLIILGLIFFLFYLFFRNHHKKFIPGPFPEKWKKILNSKVNFYSQLTPEEKVNFEFRIQHFLHTTQITGIDTEIDDIVKLLIASSAIIPVFNFPKWEYKNLHEVLIYPTLFNENYEYGTDDSRISGMVGNGSMKGKMILSKPSLIYGFSNSRDKLNVGIHEFIHLIDSTDGIIDGVPNSLTNTEFALPWINHIRLKLEEIHNLSSDINSYGGVSKSEFFPVVSEYFFERPKLLQAKHPELYKMLNEIFTVDLAKKYKKIHIKNDPGRNDPCPCGSGRKYKHCCLTK